MDVKSEFCSRIYQEFQQFKASLMKKNKETIFSESYKIEIYVNLYEILLEESKSMTEQQVLLLLNQPMGILDYLYERWMKKSDNSYEELKDCVLEVAA